MGRLTAGCEISSQRDLVPESIEDNTIGGTLPSQRSYHMLVAFGICPKTGNRGLCTEPNRVPIRHYRTIICPAANLANVLVADKGCLLADWVYRTKTSDRGAWAGVRVEVSRGASNPIYKFLM